MEEKSTSPVPPKVNAQKLMSFPEAIAQVIDGKKITRVEWGNSDYCFLGRPYLSIMRNGIERQWLVNDGDMQATDWVVLPEPN